MINPKKVIKIKKQVFVEAVIEPVNEVNISIKKVFKIKKQVACEPVVEAVNEGNASIKKVFKIKKQVASEPVVQPVNKVNASIKKVFKIKSGLPVPPVNLNPLSQTEIAFEIIREYCSENGEPISQEDLKWYYEQLEQDKKDMEQYWISNPTIKAVLDAIKQGLNDEQRFLSEQEARKREPVKVDTGELGSMPEYGSGEFWAWCRKRKALRLAKEAAIIAAGGTVPPEKPKKSRKPKVSPTKPKVSPTKPKVSPTKPKVSPTKLKVKNK